MPGVDRDDILAGGEFQLLEDVLDLCQLFRTKICDHLWRLIRESMMACSIMKCVLMFRVKYRRYLSANPLDADRKRKALTAIAAKMARVAYGIVKNGSEYQPFFQQRLPSGSIPLTRAVEAITTS